MSTSVPLQASQEVFNRSSIHPRNCKGGQHLTAFERQTKCLQQPLLHERQSERAVLDADAHELRRVAADVAKLDILLWARQPVDKIPRRARLPPQPTRGIRRASRCGRDAHPQ
jgi:hypothetical protein